LRICSNANCEAGRLYGLLETTNLASVPVPCRLVAFHWSYCLVFPNLILSITFCNLCLLASQVAFLVFKSANSVVYCACKAASLLSVAVLSCAYLSLIASACFLFSALMNASLSVTFFPNLSEICFNSSIEAFLFASIALSTVAVYNSVAESIGLAISWSAFHFPPSV
jgi:hypothetical protein